MSDKEDYSTHVQEMLKPRQQHFASVDQMNEFKAEGERLKRLREEHERHEANIRKLEAERRKH